MISSQFNHLEFQDFLPFLETFLADPKNVAEKAEWAAIEELKRVAGQSRCIRRKAWRDRLLVFYYSLGGSSGKDNVKNLTRHLLTGDVPPIRKRRCQGPEAKALKAQEKAEAKALKDQEKTEAKALMSAIGAEKDHAYQKARRELKLSPPALAAVVQEAVSSAQITMAQAALDNPGGFDYNVVFSAHPEGGPEEFKEAFRQFEGPGLSSATISIRRGVGSVTRVSDHWTVQRLLSTAWGEDADEGEKAAQKALMAWEGKQFGDFYMKGSGKGSLPKEMRAKKSHKDYKLYKETYRRSRQSLGGRIMLVYGPKGSGAAKKNKKKANARAKKWRARMKAEALTAAT